MPQAIRIECVSKVPRSEPFHCITHVGGSNSDGTRWRLPLRQAISGIKRGQWQFWTSTAGRSVWVEIAISAYGHEYLKSLADTVLPNDLLSLPECP